MIPSYQYDGVIGYNFARIADKTGRRVGGRADMSWALRATSTVALAAGDLLRQGRLPVRDRRDQEQAERDAAHADRLDGDSRNRAGPLRVAALEDIETAAGGDSTDTPPPDWVRGRNGDHDKPTDRGNRD
jgi:hypothetical protein